MSLIEERDPTLARSFLEPCEEAMKPPVPADPRA